MCCWQRSQFGAVITRQRGIKIWESTFVRRTNSSGCILDILYTSSPRAEKLVLLLAKMLPKPGLIEKISTVSNETHGWRLFFPVKQWSKKEVQEHQSYKAKRSGINRQGGFGASAPVHPSPLFIAIEGQSENLSRPVLLGFLAGCGRFCTSPVGVFLATGSPPFVTKVGLTEVLSSSFFLKHLRPLLRPAVLSAPRCHVFTSLAVVAQFCELCPSPAITYLVRVASFVLVHAIQFQM